MATAARVGTTWTPATRPPLRTALARPGSVASSRGLGCTRATKRAKTDRLDGDKLLAMLQRHHRGERVWSVVHEPTPEDEDARRTHRELARLTQERISHTNRISSLLVLH